MDINIFFNFPPGRNSARVSFGLKTVEDMKNEFRVGVIRGNEGGKIRYLKAGWVNAESMLDIKFPVQVTDQVIIEKRTKENKEILGSFKISIREKWPAKAFGSTSVNIPWSF